LLPSPARPVSAAATAGQDEDDATATYAIFHNEITVAGDALADIPAADFVSLDVPASSSVEAEPEPHTASAGSVAARTYMYVHARTFTNK
jgi:non-canonical poly(A) RNA polymerase PAPD5/7